MCYNDCRVKRSDPCTPSLHSLKQKIRIVQLEAGTTELRTKTPLGKKQLKESLIIEKKHNYTVHLNISFEGVLRQKKKNNL